MDDLGAFLKDIQENIMSEYDNLISLSIGEQEILLFLTEHEYPIRVHKVKVFNEAMEEVDEVIAAELYAELLKEDILWADLQMLAEICKKIEDNNDYFMNLLS